MTGGRLDRFPSSPAISQACRRRSRGTEPSAGSSRPRPERTAAPDERNGPRRGDGRGRDICRDALSLSDLRRDLALPAGHGSDSLQPLRSPKPHRAERRVHRRARLSTRRRSSPAPGAGGSAAHRQMRGLRRRVRFRCERACRRLSLLRQCYRRRHRTAKADQATGAGGLRARRECCEGTAQALAELTLVRAFEGQEIRPWRRQAHRRLRPVLDLRRRHVQRLCRPARRHLSRAADLRGARPQGPPRAPAPHGREDALEPGARGGCSGVSTTS